MARCLVKHRDKFTLHPYRRAGFENDPTDVRTKTELGLNCEGTELQRRASIFSDYKVTITI